MTGKDHNAHSQVNWKDYYNKKKIKGLGLVGPYKVVMWLLSKWVVYAFQPWESNLQILLHYHINNTKPK
jgi:hypothetical protein